MRQFIKAILIGVLFGCVVQSNTAIADDTELYVIDFNTQAGVQPRVMIIFDNSGSMSSKVYSKDPFVSTSSYTKVYWSGLTHQCLYFEQLHTFEQILLIQTAEPALVGHA